MGLYELPQIKYAKIKKFFSKTLEAIKSRTFLYFLTAIVLFSFLSFAAGIFSGNYLYDSIKEYLGKWNIILPVVNQASQATPIPGYTPQTSQEEAVIRVVKEASPAVVSIIISKDVPVLEQYYYNPFPNLAPDFSVPQYRQKGTEKKEIGGGTGFIISEDGLILTNKHVVNDKEAEYTVFTNDGEKYTARVLAKDPVQDLAIFKIEQDSVVNKDGEIVVEAFPIVRLGDSSVLQIGQSVIAIGNALGEYRNTVSVGVVSGLGRTISASGGGMSEILEDIIQSDSAINPGNSGGPLLNLRGEVIGINTAIAQEAQNIGFAIPINKAKRDIEQVVRINKIVYPFLGVRYVLVNEKIKEDKKLLVDYGALILKGDNGEPAITLGSAAEKAGLKENDIILEFNGQKITKDNSLARMISNYNPGDKVTLKVLSDGQEKNLEVVLGERGE